MWNWDSMDSIINGRISSFTTIWLTLNNYCSLLVFHALNENDRRFIKEKKGLVIIRPLETANIFKLTWLLRRQTSGSKVFIYIVLFKRMFSGDVPVNVIQVAEHRVQKWRWPLENASRIPGMQRAKCKSPRLEN